MKNVTLVLPMLALAACGQPTSTVDYHADGSQTVTIHDRTNGNITAQIGGSAKMPTDLPAWAPAYPGSVVVMAQNQNLKTAGGPVENVVLQTSDSLAKVAAFYDAKIAQAGLKPMHAASGDDASIRMVDTPAGIVGVSASKAEDGGSTISITRMPKT